VLLAYTEYTYTKFTYGRCDKLIIIKGKHIMIYGHTHDSESANVEA